MGNSWASGYQGWSQSAWSGSLLPSLLPTLLHFWDEHWKFSFPNMWTNLYRKALAWPIWRMEVSQNSVHHLHVSGLSVVEIKFPWIGIHCMDGPFSGIFKIHLSLCMVWKNDLISYFCMYLFSFPSNICWRDSLFQHCVVLPTLS